LESSERLGSAIRPDLDSETIEVGRCMRARSLGCSAELHHQSGRDQRGKLPPLTRQLFVLPFAFTARAVGKVLAFCRPRLEFFSHIHPCGWISGGKGRIRDWHDGTQISLDNPNITQPLPSRCDGDHKNAFSCCNHHKKRLKRDGHHNRAPECDGHHMLWPNFEGALRGEKPWKAGLPKPPPYCRACLSL
jgi:hypothetical protein